MTVNSQSENHKEKAECDILIKNALVICLDDKDTILSDGALAIKDSYIVGVGDSKKIEQSFEPGETINAENNIVMPGFINPHNHTPLMIVRGMIEDLNFAPSYTSAVPKIHNLNFDDALTLSRQGVYEMLKAGITTIVDYYQHPRALAQASEELGMRAVVGGRIHDADTALLGQGRYEHRTDIGNKTLAETLDLIENHHNNCDGRIRCDFAPHAADTCSSDLLKEVAAYARDHGGNVHTHLAQSRKEIDHVKDRDNKLPHQVFADAGLLDERLIAAHSVFLDESDINEVGQAGVTIAHAPHQNGRAGNIAPIIPLAKAGARINICTDTRSADMFEAMRLAVTCARIKEGGMEPLSPRVLRWCTTEPAKSLRIPNVTGSIEKNTKADVILLDKNSPNLVPMIDGYGILVHSGQSLNIDTVIINGAIQLRNGKPVNFDGDSISRSSQSVATKLWNNQTNYQAVT